MKCVQALEEKERLTGREVKLEFVVHYLKISSLKQFDIVILGGLSGRLDQTVHTLSYLHKLRKTRKRVFTVTDDNVGWVLNEVCRVTFFSAVSHHFRVNILSTSITMYWDKRVASSLSALTQPS
jgi:thiamine pyrophosphokinase